jgi:hypothetical protein
MVVPPTRTRLLRLSPLFGRTSKVIVALPLPCSGAAVTQRPDDATSHEQKSSVVSCARTSPPGAPTVAADGVILHGHVAASWVMLAR